MWAVRGGTLYALDINRSLVQMNAMDMPAAPPAKGPMTLSEMGTELHATFKDKANTEEELAWRINAALDTLLAQGLVREWGFDADGRTVYAPDRAFELAPPHTYTLPAGTVIYTFWTYDTKSDDE